MEEHITVPADLTGQLGQNGASDGDGGGGGPPPPPVQLDSQASQTTSTNDGIAGMSAMRGLLLYAAVLAFAGLYIYFMVIISQARSGTKPAIDATLISTAAALSGVLGSAFALKIGVTPNPSLVNSGLGGPAPGRKSRPISVLLAGIRKALSLEPGDTNGKSWPLTFGIWAYALVAASVVVVYVLNQNETPGTVKALAVTFGGYVLALIHMAYSMGKQDQSN